MTKIGILIRGYHKIVEHTTRNQRHYTSPKCFDFRECFFSFIKMIVEPLEQAQYDISIYVSTYHSIIEKSLKGVPYLKNTILLNENGSTQLKTYYEGLKSMPDTLDCYLVVRFDLWYKKKITEWLPICIQEKPHICLSWKEYYNNWNKDRRVGDVIHFMNREGKKILQSILRIASNDKDFMHYLYPQLEHKGVHLTFLTQGYYDSNPTYDGRPECCNPFYIFWGRPYHHHDWPLGF